MSSAARLGRRAHCEQPARRWPIHDPFLPPNTISTLFLIRFHVFNTVAMPHQTIPASSSLTGLLQAFENTQTNVAAAQMRNALTNIAETVEDPQDKKVRWHLCYKWMPECPRECHRY